MKNIIILAAILGGLVSSLAAQNAAAVNQKKMDVFATFAGRWAGESEMRMPTGELKKARVLEHIQYKLDNTILLIEGTGTAKDSANAEIIVHEALAILSYDSPSNTYKFRSHIRDGRQTDAWFKVIDTSNYAWGFEGPGYQMKYNIAIDPEKNTWHETGSFSRDGKSWSKVFEMNLQKI